MSRRQKVSEQRRAAFWARRAKGARTPEDQALVAWDRLRAVIADMSPADRDHVWASAADRLDGIRAAITDGVVHTDVHIAGNGPRGGQRAEARLREAQRSVYHRHAS